MITRFKSLFLRQFKCKMLTSVQRKGNCIFIHTQKCTFADAVTISDQNVTCTTSEYVRHHALLFIKQFLSLYHSSKPYPSLPLWIPNNVDNFDKYLTYFLLFHYPFMFLQKLNVNGVKMMNTIQVLIEFFR